MGGDGGKSEARKQKKKLAEIEEIEKAKKKLLAKQKSEGEIDRRLRGALGTTLSENPTQGLLGSTVSLGSASILG